MGKANKRRACPEAGRKISSAECGEGRQSDYPCPPECAHNPFAAVNYTRLLEIEDELDRKPVVRLRDDTPDAGPINRNLHRRDGRERREMQAAWTLRFFPVLRCDV